MIVAVRLLVLTLFPLTLLSGQSGDVPGVDRLDLIAGMRSADPDRRIAALRAAEPRLAGRSDLVLQGILRRLTKDPDREVRHQVAISLGNTGLGRPVLKRFAEVSLRELLVFAADRSTVRVVIQCCEKKIATMLRELIDDPRFAAEAEGRSEVLRALAEDLLLQRDSEAIVEVLDLINQEPPGWRRQALLSGVLMNLPSGIIDADKLHFAFRPRALDRMRASEDAQLRQAAERIAKVSTWIGGVSPLDRGESALFTRGERLYGLNCVACHRQDGLGTSILAPPLVGSEWVLESDERLVRILTSGLTGPVTVAGKRYQMSGMVGFPGLDDEQIAALIIYLRRAWEHQGEPITTEEVARIRAEIGDHRGPWTEVELLRLRE